jgi:hypothetical protein
MTQKIVQMTGMLSGARAGLDGAWVCVACLMEMLSIVVGG